MIPDAGNQFALFRQFHQVIVRAHSESPALDLGILLGGEHDDWSVSSGGISPKEADENETVDGGDGQILENNGGADPIRLFDSVNRIGTVVEVDVRQILQHAAHSLSYDGLIVNE